jgi:hypothetical protein
MNQLEKFDKLCTKIFYWKGKFRFPFDGIQHDGKFETIVKSEDYPLLEEKLKNLLVLINQDMTKINQDTEELWEVI